jgi:DNA-binding Lrp family transcriptional regulator
MESKSLYVEGHLFVAAVRIIEHRHKAPPALDQIAKMLGFSSEQTGLISRRLEQHGIIELVESAYGDRWAVADHLQLEALPSERETSQLDDELKKFQAKRNKITKKVEDFKEQQAQKQKDLFSELQKQLKKQLKKD